MGQGLCNYRMLNAEVSFEIKFVLNFQVADKNNKNDNNNNNNNNNSHNNKIIILFPQ